MDRDSQTIEDEVIYEEYIGRKEKRKKGSKSDTSRDFIAGRGSDAPSRPLFQVRHVDVSIFPNDDYSLMVLPLEG